VRLGPFRRSARGVQTAWACCPLSVACKLAEQQRIEVGWSSMRIELLSARPIQCFRCWHYGHVRSNCRSKVDRKGLCFGCGSEGHSLRDCGTKPLCVVCRDSGFSHQHRLGSVSCGSMVMARNGGGSRRVKQ